MLWCMQTWPGPQYSFPVLVTSRGQFSNTSYPLSPTRAIIHAPSVTIIGKIWRLSVMLLKLVLHTNSSLISIHSCSKCINDSASCFHCIKWILPRRYTGSVVWISTSSPSIYERERSTDRSKFVYRSFDLFFAAHVSKPIISPHEIRIFWYIRNERELEVAGRWKRLEEKDQQRW